MKASLVPLEGNGPRIELKRDISVLGRTAGCDILIDHESLSRRHAVLVMTDGLVVARDLITTNGTRVNGQRVRWAALMPNDRISFGAVRFRIELAPDTGFVRSDAVSQGPSMTDLFGNMDSPVPGPLNEMQERLRSHTDSELSDDSQNTEIGGWRPPAGS